MWNTNFVRYSLPQNQSLAILLEGAFYYSFLEITQVTETAKKFSVQVYSTTRLVALLPLSRIADRHYHNPLLSRWQEQGQTEAFV